MAKCFTHVCPGIAVVSSPYMFIPVGDEFDRHVRVAIGRQMPPRIEEVTPEGMRFKVPTIFTASYIVRPGRVEGDEPRKKDVTQIVAPRDNDRMNALLQVALPAGYQGDSVITVHTKAKVIADCFTGHSVRDNLGTTHHVLACLAPGGELRGRISGYKVEKTCHRWVYDGEEILYFSGDESVFLDAAEHMASLNSPQP
jgi:hypothetical protein